AVPTRCTPSIRTNSICSRSAASGSSSAIRIFRSLSSVIVVNRHGERRFITSNDWAETDIGPVAEMRPKPLRYIGQAKSGALVSRCPRLLGSSAEGAVGHIQLHAAAIQPAGANGKFDALGRGRHAIFDRVFNQW